jgi:hypothetical protein
VKTRETREERTVENPGAEGGEDDEFSDIMSQYLLQADQGKLVLSVSEICCCTSVSQYCQYVTLAATVKFCYVSIVKVCIFSIF